LGKQQGGKVRREGGQVPLGVEIQGGWGSIGIPAFEVLWLVDVTWRMILQAERVV